MRLRVGTYFWFFVLGTMLVVHSACTPSLKVNSHVVKHMVAIKGNGEIFDLEVSNENQRQLLTGMEAYKNQLQGIKENIKVERDHKRILIYVHGGLVGIKDSVLETEDLLNKMEGVEEREDGQRYYPIIVNWESGALPAYLDHLYRIRNGREAPILGKTTAPFYFLWDVGRAIVRYPIDLALQIYKGVLPVVVPTDQDLGKYNEKFLDGQLPDKILLGENNQEVVSTSGAGNFLTYLFPGVLKIVTIPVLETFGKPGWDNMIRRTQTVFRTPDEFTSEVRVTQEIKKLARIESLTISPPLKPGKESQPTGGLALLMEQLRVLKQELKAEHLNPDEYKITLIGHSMGTIILNQVIQLYGDEEKDFEIDEIVYLAAASTIRDFELSVIPHLRKYPRAKFYNLTLHPEADARERYMLDAFPRGSLLEWIDDFARNPASFMELTLGKWNNAIAAWHIILPSDLRPRVTLKGFGIEDPQYNNRKDPENPDEILLTKPQRHAEINDLDQLFWRPDYWKVPKE